MGMKLWWSVARIVGQLGELNRNARVDLLHARPTMKIAEFSERERALDLLARTERLCLVARALDIPLRFEPQLEVTPAEVSV
jgi:organic hydroperoxide reductase OsmC/OhrA